LLLIVPISAISIFTVSPALRNSFLPAPTPASCAGSRGRLSGYPLVPLVQGVPMLQLAPARALNGLDRKLPANGTCARAMLFFGIIG
jgi:hypothetical protein